MSGKGSQRRPQQVTEQQLAARWAETFTQPEEPVEQKTEGMWLADGLEHAFLGLVYRGGLLDPVACYDYDAVIRGFMEDGCTEEDAIEHFQYNVIGGYVGERMPVYLQRMTIAQAIEIAEAE